jgi:hypothetical protein
MSRMLFAALMLAALVTSSVKLPASECVAAGSPIGKSCRMACCANKTCCIDSQKKQHEPAKLPVTRDNASDQQFVAAIAAPIISAHLNVDAVEQLRDSTAAGYCRFALRPALLCTFLI